MAYRVTAYSGWDRKQVQERLKGELDGFCELIEAVARDNPVQNPYTLTSRLRYSANSIKGMILKLGAETSPSEEDLERILNMLFGALAATRFLLDHSRRCELIPEQIYFALSRHRNNLVRILQDNFQSGVAKTSGSREQWLEAT